MKQLILIIMLIVTNLTYAVPVTALKGTSHSDVAIDSLRVSDITFQHLLRSSKVDNVTTLLDKAKLQQIITLSDQIKYAKQFKDTLNGDQVLLTCLKSPSCNLDESLKIANASELHNKVFINGAPLTLATANKMVGNITENLMHKSFTRSGWQQLNGEIGVNGFDGLYVKRNGRGAITEVLIAESKYNKSGLNETQRGIQMSSDWVKDKIANLINKYPEDDDYKAIETFIKNGKYRSLLWNVKVEGDSLLLDVKRVHSRGSSIEKQKLIGGDNINPTYEKNRIISLEAPTNSYQTMMVENFFNQLSKLQ